MSQSETVKSINDQFRENFGLIQSLYPHPLGVYSISQGITNLNPLQQLEIALKIRNFNMSQYDRVEALFLNNSQGSFDLERFGHRVHWSIEEHFKIDGSQITDHGCDILCPEDARQTIRHLHACLDFEF